MSITKESELVGMQRVSEAVALTLKLMREYASPGMTTKTLDEYGGRILKTFGAVSAPARTYNFPGYTCISVNQAIAHGVPSNSVILKEGDLVNIDVSAELDGFWSDNGGSFVLGNDILGYGPLVSASKEILLKAISQVRGGVRVAEVGRLIEQQAKQKGYHVIRNLTGHGIGRKLHEEPLEIANYYDASYKARFKKNGVVAIETFIATQSTLAKVAEDKWTLRGNKGGVVAQHEHTIMITDEHPVILTAMNEI